MNKESHAQHGATVVVTHRVRAGMHAEYEDWLNEIGPVCRSSVGHLDLQIIRPIPSIAASYTIIIRFDTVDHLKAWITSRDREQLIEKAARLLVADDAYTIHGGLDFWFMPHGLQAKVPARWKQFLVTWSAIYPLALGVPFMVIPILRHAAVPECRFLDAIPVSAVIVLLMVYVVMPNYTKMVRTWLYK